jgi:hypothetical protein
MQDVAPALRWLVDEHYPEARVIRLVLDNLTPHTLAACMPPFLLLRRVALPSAWNCPSRPSMGVG